MLAVPIVSMRSATDCSEPIEHGAPERSGEVAVAATTDGDLADIEPNPLPDAASQREQRRGRLSAHHRGPVPTARQRETHTIVSRVKVTQGLVDAFRFFRGLDPHVDTGERCTCDNVLTGPATYKSDVDTRPTARVVQADDVEYQMRQRLIALFPRSGQAQRELPRPAPRGQNS